MRFPGLIQTLPSVVESGVHNASNFDNGETERDAAIRPPSRGSGGLRIFANASSSSRPHAARRSPMHGALGVNANAVQRAGVAHSEVRARLE